MKFNRAEMAVLAGQPGHRYIIIPLSFSLYLSVSSLSLYLCLFRLSLFLIHLLSSNMQHVLVKHISLILEIDILNKFIRKKIVLLKN